MRASDTVRDPEAGVTVTAVLRVMILFDRCIERFLARWSVRSFGTLGFENGLSPVRPLPPHPELQGPDLRVRLQMRRALCSLG